MSRPEDDEERRGQHDAGQGQEEQVVPRPVEERDGGRQAPAFEERPGAYSHQPAWRWVVTGSEGGVRWP